MTARGARKVVQKLIASGILVPEPDAVYDVSYFAPEILAILQ